MTRRVFRFCLVALASLPLYAETDYYSVESILSFADWLYGEGDYARAGSEYLKASVLEGDRARDEVFRKVSASFLKGGDYAGAEKYLLLFADRYPGSPLVDSALYDLAFVYFKTGRYDDSMRVLSFLEYASPLLGERARALGGVELCIGGNWALAKKLVAEPAGTGSGLVREVSGSLAGLADRVAAAEEKSPVAAGVLSAIVPGLGKIYADRTLDGLFSFISVGIFAGLSAWSFYEDGISSARAWTYAAVGAAFYAGNVYGSVMAAIIRNRGIAESFADEARALGDELGL